MVKINTIPESKRRRKQRLYILLASVVFLSAAGGSLIYWCPPSLQEIGRQAASFVGKISQNSAGMSPAEPVLRGTIYDRSLKELAVSYRLFNLAVQPSEVTDRKKTARALADILGKEEDDLESKLTSHRRVISLGDDLDQEQADAIADLDLEGVYCNPSEVRFYPAHTSGAQTLGFADQGVGLYGVEGKFDTVLQPGEFRNSAIADIDFGREEVLGRSTTDVVLTLDVDLQRLLDKNLRVYLQQQGARKGMGVLVEPFSGKILAVMSQPTFNPNYYWQADEQVRINRVYRHRLNKKLIQPLLTRAAAIDRDGLSRRRMLPPTIASPDYGVDAQEKALFDYKLRLFEPVKDSWGMPDDQPAAGKALERGWRDTLTGAQIASAVASLVNGGWRITPYILHGLYDHQTGEMYLKKQDSVKKKHILEPASGIVLRRELFHTGSKGKIKENQETALSSTFVDVAIENGMSRYTMQELYVGMVPSNMPRYLLVMAVEREQLNPLPAVEKKKRLTLQKVGSQILAKALSETEPEVSVHPQGKSVENFRRFLISKRLDYQGVEQQESETFGQMPVITGLSLRKALQRLNRYQVRLRIHGTGTIVAQVPAPGNPVPPGQECILTLESEI